MRCLTAYVRAARACVPRSTFVFCFVFFFSAALRLHALFFLLPFFFFFALFSSVSRSLVHHHTAANRFCLLTLQLAHHE